MRENFLFHLSLKKNAFQKGVYSVLCEILYAIPTIMSRRKENSVMPSTTMDSEKHFKFLWVTDAIKKKKGMI